MNFQTVVRVLLLYVCQIWQIWALPGGYGRRKENSHEIHRYPPVDYTFAYEIKDTDTLNYQNRYESTKDGKLHGSYSLLAPDGVVRTTYYSDNGDGYQAILHEKPVFSKPYKSQSSHYNHSPAKKANRKTSDRFSDFFTEEYFNKFQELFGFSQIDDNGGKSFYFRPIKFYSSSSSSSSESAESGEISRLYNAPVDLSEEGSEESEIFLELPEEMQISFPQGRTANEDVDEIEGGEGDEENVQEETSGNEKSGGEVELDGGDKNIGETGGHQQGEDWPFNGDKENNGDQQGGDEGHGENVQLDKINEENVQVETGNNQQSEGEVKLTGGAEFSAIKGQLELPESENEVQGGTHDTEGKSQIPETENKVMFEEISEANIGGSINEVQNLEILKNDGNIEQSNLEHEAGKGIEKNPITIEEQFIDDGVDQIVIGTMAGDDAKLGKNEIETDGHNRGKSFSSLADRSNRLEDVPIIMMDKNLPDLMSLESLISNTKVVNNIPVITLNEKLFNSLLSTQDTLGGEQVVSAIQHALIGVNRENLKLDIISRPQDLSKILSSIAISENGKNNIVAPNELGAFIQQMMSILNNEQELADLNAQTNAENDLQNDGNEGTLNIGDTILGEDIGIETASVAANLASLGGLGGLGFGDEGDRGLNAHMAEFQELGAQDENVGLGIENTGNDAAFGGENEINQGGNFGLGNEATGVQLKFDGNLLGSLGREKTGNDVGFGGENEINADNFGFGNGATGVGLELGGDLGGLGGENTGNNIGFGGENEINADNFGFGNRATGLGLELGGENTGNNIGFGGENEINAGHHFGFGNEFAGAAPELGGEGSIGAASTGIKLTPEFFKESGFGDRGVQFGQFESPFSGGVALPTGSITNGLPQNGGIPVFGVPKTLFDSLSLPGSTYTQADLAREFQLAVKNVLASNRNGQGGEDFALEHQEQAVLEQEPAKFQQEANFANILGEAAFQGNTATSSGGVPLNIQGILQQNNFDIATPNLGTNFGAIEQPLKTSASTTIGGIPVIAIDQRLFNSLSTPNNPLTKEDLIRAIQNATQSVLKQAQRQSLRISPGLKNSNPKNTNDILASENNGDAGIPVVVVDQKLLGTLSKTEVDTLISAIQKAITASTSPQVKVRAKKHISPSNYRNYRPPLEIRAISTKRYTFDPDGFSLFSSL